MKIGDDSISIEFSEADPDGDMLLSISTDFQQVLSFVVINQDEIKALIAHLQKQVKQDE